MAISSSCKSNDSSTTSVSTFDVNEEIITYEYFPQGPRKLPKHPKKYEFSCLIGVLIHANLSKRQPRHKPFIFPFVHSGNFMIFCLSDFTWNQIWRIWKCLFCRFWASEVQKFITNQNPETLNVSKLVDFETLNSPTFISRKIWLTEKFSNFLTSLYPYRLS